ncbi:TetR/AcrR family transcriptional regulator [Thomasclavelia sp.]
MKSTKEKILIEALTLFSENGYESVSVNQIALAVGIKAPSLYKHYKNKKDIFNAIILNMQNRYLEFAKELEMNGILPEQDRERFINISEIELINLGKSMFLYFLHDEFQSKFRKMLTIEQFKNKELAKEYIKQYFDDSLTYQQFIFKMLSQQNVLIDEDPSIIALHFYGPIYFLISLCDACPEREEEALKTLEKHIQQFNRLYRNLK